MYSYLYYWNCKHYKLYLRSSIRSLYMKMIIYFSEKQNWISVWKYHFDFQPDMQFLNLSKIHSYLVSNSNYSGAIKKKILKVINTQYLMGICEIMHCQTFVCLNNWVNYCQIPIHYRKENKSNTECGNVRPTYIIHSLYNLYPHV